MGEKDDDLLMKLPAGFREKFMQQVVSRTSPQDACRVSCVSKLFQSVADSDVVWDSFIIPDQLQSYMLSSTIFDCNSSKDLFMVLTVFPAKGDDDDDDSRRSVSYFLDQWSGKRWLSLSIHKLSITYLHTDYWQSQIPTWGPTLGHVVWLEIKAKTSTSKLSANTTYTAYLLFALSNKFFHYGFHIPVETSVGITEEESINKFVYLDPAIAKSECQYLKHRDDDLLEVELGDYFHNDGENRDVEMIVREVKSGKPKCGISIYKMELRPKREIINLSCKSYHQTHSYAERNIERREGEMSKEGEEVCENTNFFSMLPEGFAQTFMEEVVSRTSPVDACRLSVVAKSFRSAAESDVVWERFLPSDYKHLLSRTDSLLNISFGSKKDLYLFLIGNPLPIDANTKGFWLDKWSGKKCFMITTSFTKHDDTYSLPFRYYNQTWSEIHGKISTSMLSSDTTYTAYLVHKSEFRDGFNYPMEDPTPFEASVGSSVDESVRRVVYLDRKNGETDSQYAVERKDGWLEVELGEFFNKGGENKDLEMSVMEITSELKGDYKIQGIEIRPKHG